MSAHKPEIADTHAPVAVIGLSDFPDWVFIRCACGEQPISRVWLLDHWTGDPEAGKAAVHEVIAAQAAAEQRTRPAKRTPEVDQ